MLGTSGSVSVSAQSTYSVIDLGSFTSTSDFTAACADDYAGSAYALNDDGVVAGRTGWSDKPAAAFRATDGKIKRLKSGKGGGAGWDINASGQIAGYIADDLGDDPCSMMVRSGETGAHHAATWVGGELQLLPGGDVEFSYAIAINDDGVIVGAVANMPVLWRDGVLEELPMPSGTTFGTATGINASGQVIGIVQDQEYKNQGVLWDQGELTLLPDGFLPSILADDGTLYGTTNEGKNAGRLVDDQVESLPGLTDDVTFIYLSGISSNGDILGEISKGDIQTPVLWTDGDVIELTTLVPDGDAYASISPSDINKSGMILLNGTSADGQPRGIVSSPEQS